MGPLANDVRLAPGQLVTPDFTAHARRLLAALGQPHKIYDSEPVLCRRSRWPRTGCALTAATQSRRLGARTVIADHRPRCETVRPAAAQIARSVENSSRR